MCNKGRIVVLTGISGSGKTTISKHIEKKYKTVVVIRYGEILYNLKRKEHPELSYLEFKAKSSTLIKKEDIALVDSLIVKKAIDKKQEGLNVIIESHAVTTEPYGLKISPYSAVNLGKLVINSVLVVYADGKTINGRLDQLRPHQQDSRLYEIANNLQSSLALSYALLNNTEVHIINNCLDLSGSYSRVDELMSKIGIK